MLESVRKLEKTLNFLGIEPCLSIRQGDALTGGPIMLTVDFLFLILCKCLKVTYKLTNPHTRKCTQAGKNPELPGSRLYDKQTL